jgi:hypothetical protein
MSTDNIANRDEAFKCLEIARAALRQADFTKAEKFAQKGFRLYKCHEVR